MTIIPKNPHNVKPYHKELVARRLLAGESITQAKFCDMTSKSSRLAPRILNRVGLYQALQVELGKKAILGVVA